MSLFAEASQRRGDGNGQWERCPRASLGDPLAPARLVGGPGCQYTEQPPWKVSLSLGDCPNLESPPGMVTLSSRSPLIAHLQSTCAWGTEAAVVQFLSPSFLPHFPITFEPLGQLQATLTVGSRSQRCKFSCVSLEGTREEDGALLHFPCAGKATA